jgi:Ca2+-binding RTX toxin-like protein
MANLSFPGAGTSGVNMLANFFPLPEYAYKATQTSTNFTLFYSPSTYDKFTGSGFHYDVNGYPYSGTISSWVYLEGGKTIFSVTSLNMPVSEYMTYFNANDWEGLLAAAFDGNDTITGNAGQDDLYGYSGNDVIKAGNAYDIVYGDDGNDKLYGEGGDDDLYGGTGDDTLEGAAGIDWLFGGDDRDRLLGGADADELYGNAGDDTLDGGAGADYFEGGDGNDLYIFDTLGDLAIESNPNASGGSDDEIRTSVIIQVATSIIEHYTYTGSKNWTFTANGENNKLTGGAGHDQLDGSTGNDIIKGNGGNDTLIGGAGNDSLIGGAGSDKLRGGAGNDTYYVENGDTIDEQGNFDGNDHVIATSSVNLSVLGGGFIEHAELTGKTNINATGNASANQLTGNDGANVLDGLGGSDFMAGGLGNDIYVVDEAGDQVLEHDGQGIDLVRSAVAVNLISLAGFEHVELTGGADLDATGDEGANNLTGNAGGNRLDGGTGKDKLTGGLGDDTYVLDQAGDTVNEIVTNAKGGGIDTIEAGFTFSLAKDANVDNLALTGGGNFNGTGNALANVITGNAGSNLLDGGAGADLLKGGAGNDKYVLDHVGDVVDEEGNTDTGDEIVTKAAIAGLFVGIENYTYTGTKAWTFAADGSDNRLSGGTATDNLDGADGNDTLLGNGGNDILTGGIGDDLLDGGAGDDQMKGGAGNDTYVIGSAKDVVNEETNLDTDDRVRSTFTVNLTTFAGGAIEHVTLTGTAAINATGNAAANELVGNDGANVLNGNVGADTMVGGKGADTYVVDNAGDVVIESIAGAAGGIDTVTSSVDFDLSGHVNVERLTLTDTALSATGNALANTLTGNAEDNVLDGGDAKDTMIGGDGDDTVIGGLGADKLTGGIGRDTFDFNLLADAGDTIGDFKLGATGDILDLSDLLDDIGYAGTDAIADGVVLFTKSGTNTIVRIDEDGSLGAGAAVTLVTLTNATLTASHADNYAL